MQVRGSKDLTKILQQAEEQGWVFEFTNKGHIKGKHPNGQTTTISKTLGGRHKYRTVERYLKVNPQQHEQRVA